ncbi:hypothetical protein AALO_G00174500 [Alosa alosa]|uniref:Metalloendopeptidase n=1 Tax=Alosa alosa TaxID=278164 RepID=A0AAV6G770_9TELE|nr:hypothetical protein AALO_G00174500 [Alosa alosa]
MKQTLSIGTYCDHISVVEHEFLHALGFLHEQSRYDRKDFITINWYNIGQDDSIFFLDHCSFDEGMCEMSSAGWERVSRADEGPQSDHTYLGMESQGDISVQVYSGVDR